MRNCILCALFVLSAANWAYAQSAPTPPTGPIVLPAGTVLPPGAVLPPGVVIAPTPAPPPPAAAPLVAAETHYDQEEMFEGTLNGANITSRRGAFRGRNLSVTGRGNAAAFAASTFQQVLVSSNDEHAAATAALFTPEPPPAVIHHHHTTRVVREVEPVYIEMICPPTTVRVYPTVRRCWP